MTHDFTPPIREDLVGVSSYGAPQLDVPARLNVNENPFSMPDDLAAAMGAVSPDTLDGYCVVGELGLEPGGLRRHDLTFGCHRNKILGGGRTQGEPDGCAT